VGVFVVWFLIAFVGLTISYLSYDKILAIDHITRYCNVAVLGTVAKYDSDIPVSQLVVDKKPKSLIAESFRNIRTNLDFISNEPGSKIIAVTSTISGEGKTFVSINLGGILAYAGKKVIIIDADMRKPKIHLGFNVSNDNGLSNLLIARTTLEESINHSTLDNLHFITAGPIPPNPSELLLGQRMTDIIATLQKEYDYVLIDNPPIGIVTDSMTLLQRADYPIYVFRAGVSRKFFINYLQKLILDNKFKNLSFVLNGMDMKKSSQYGYGNYGYTTSGYGYYEEDKKKFSFKINRKKKKK
jgi:capsular exopolysaccharide synthesis family protein